MSKKLGREAFSNFVRALAFASRKHSQQRRKDADASPYINHPIALVSILAVEAGINDCDTLCAALLHDTIEDTDTSVEELVEAFGVPIASMVQEVTDDKRLPKAERKLLQVEHAAHLSPKARSVKLADKPKARLQQPTAARPYRELERGRLKQVYERVSDGRRLTVIRRRGFGQYALAEFPDRTIGIFVHRGDSPGEGGSNTYFLANKDLHHEPLSRLLNKLTRRLTNCALIISDGSLVDRCLEKKFREQQFVFGGFEWRHVGFIGGWCGRPTPIWDVVRQGAT